MSQAFLFAAMQLLGIVVAAAFGPRRHAWLCCALSFPAGLALTVLTALSLVAFGFRYDIWSMSAAIGIAFVTCSVRAVQVGFLPRHLRLCLAYSAGFLGLSTLLTMRNFTIMSQDSHWFALYGGVLAADGGLAPGTLEQLQAWGMFQVVAQSLAQFTRQDFLYGLPPVLGISLAVLFVASLREALRLLDVDALSDRRQKLTFVLLVATFVSTPMLVRHDMYLHTNLAAALYLLGFIVLFWMAELERNPDGLPIAFLFLLAFTFQRVETPGPATLALLVTATMSTLPFNVVLPKLAVFSAVVAAWHIFLGDKLPEDAPFLNPFRCALVAFGVLSFFAASYAFRTTRLFAMRRLIPAAIILSLALAIAATCVLKPDHMLESIGAWARNIVHPRQWGLTWIGAIIAFALLARTPAPVFGQAFSTTIVANLLFILLMAAGRVPYRVSIHDSANRMTLHVLPLVFFYLALKLLPSRSPKPGAEPSLSGDATEPAVSNACDATASAP